MGRRSYCSAALSLLTCLLTLAGSGDDLNLARLALPSAFADAPPGSLPLDDDNTDFSEPTDSRVLLSRESTPQQRPDWALWHPAAVNRIPASVPAPLDAPWPHGRPPLRALLFVPLRC
jgi:hypothetical protein